MEYPRALPFISHEPALRSAPQKRLLLSFWEREVNIWKLTKPFKPTSEPEDPEDEPGADNRKLVAKVLIKGDANITSATLSDDGELLAVSTITDVKVFYLRPRKPEAGEGLKVSKVEVPASFSFGARSIHISPDRKWLCIIRPDSRIYLARIVDSSSSITIHDKLTQLSRINRKIQKHIILGGLGTYDRTVTQAEFSSDSRILAVSDLAGYVDTFVLSGQEDLSLPATTHTDAALLASPSVSDSDIDSDEDSNPSKLQQIFGQHWSRNPSASSLPRLPSTPVLLSFRPSMTPLTLTNGTHAISTRHNPNPIAHDIPAGEDRLLIVTARSEVYEFEVLKGALSPWSRRNPTASFPEEFRQLLDAARGCVWDVSGGRERVWLYGSSWLWMFDLARDIPPTPPIEPQNGQVDDVDTSKKSKKRKRHGKEVASGAGSSVPDRKLGLGISRTMQKVTHEEVDEIEKVPLGGKDKDAMDIDSDSGADSDSDSGQELALRLRREEDGTNEKGKRKHNHWHTFKYRPILGIVKIGDEGGELGPEVAIVERPIWEANLGPRYFGDQEWEQGSLR